MEGYRKGRCGLCPVRCVLRCAHQSDRHQADQCSTEIYARTHPDLGAGFPCGSNYCVCFQYPLGQKVRTIGQNRKVATASGINVDRVRIQAVIFSTILASWGQIIALQNMGTFSTYTAHEMVGTYAVAALLVGGATLNKATIKQAMIGCLLFHLLFFMAPIAARNLFNDTMVGEYFRMFLSYGIIVLSLVLYAWQPRKVKGGK